jgi:hypothetical protein
VSKVKSNILHEQNYQLPPSRFHSSIVIFCAWRLMPLENRVWWGVDDQLSHRSIWAFHPLDGVRSSKLEIDCAAGITAPCVRNRQSGKQKRTQHPAHTSLRNARNFATPFKFANFPALPCIKVMLKPPRHPLQPQPHTTQTNHTRLQ